MQTQKCKGCGREVIFARDQKGTCQIIDPAPPVFAFHVDGAHRTRCQRLSPLMYGVSHFATCPKAGELSKKNSRPPSPPERPASTRDSEADTRGPTEAAAGLGEV